MRDLAERGLLHGEPGAYVLRGDVADVSRRVSDAKRSHRSTSTI